MTTFLAHPYRATTRNIMKMPSWDSSRFSGQAKSPILRHPKVQTPFLCFPGGFAHTSIGKSRSAEQHPQKNKVFFRTRNKRGVQLQLHAFTPEVVLQHFVGPSILLLDSSPLVTLDVTHDDFEKHARPRTISAVLNQNTHVRTHMHMYTYIHTHMCPHAHNLIHHTHITHLTRTRTLMHNKVLFVKRDRLNRVSEHTACHLPSSFPSSHKCTHAHTKRTT